MTSTTLIQHVEHRQRWLSKAMADRDKLRDFTTEDVQVILKRNHGGMLDSPVSKIEALADNLMKLLARHRQLMLRRRECRCADDSSPSPECSWHHEFMATSQLLTRYEEEQPRLICTKNDCPMMKKSAMTSVTMPTSASSSGDDGAH